MGTTVCYGFMELPQELPGSAWEGTNGGIRWGSDILFCSKLSSSALIIDIIGFSQRFHLKMAYC